MLSDNAKYITIYHPRFQKRLFDRLPIGEFADVPSLFVLLQLNRLKPLQKRL
jgi:hypothetical protein